ncbi:hypothetical protein Ocin01_05948 [Orchesella cincta]|uniref:Nucleolus and neural progenitor protein-like N-terminal domain-containing protein n=1 Tax=Orchesella cincta TaxID=48709 RepID=A0A1D2N6Y6_ORCCI|nr:hypothetical protein Ocin01_05948 [Orchesella cincta]
MKIPPPFVTVSVEDKESRRRIFQTWSKLSKSSLDEKTSTFSSEGELLQAFILRKGTQLRLEKAMMLSRRILTLVSRWKANACWGDFCKFKDAFESDDAKLKPSKKSGKRQAKKSDHVKGGSMQEIHLPSRQWANWVLYLILRDLLLLSKIKWESERTVGYWLGMISCSHHPGDSLIIVGILSRIWAVSSGMVEGYANELYPSLRFISLLLCPTRADNWLEDIDFPNDLFTWLGKILGFPFQPAKIGNYDQFLRTEGIKASSKIDRILGGVFSSSQEDSHQDYKNLSDVPSTSSAIRDLTDNADDEEDFGVPVSVQEESETETAKEKPNRRKKQKLNEQINKKVCLDEKWTKFFKNFKSKLSTEGGRQQLLVRIRKYKKKESNPEINARLVKLHKFVKRDDRDKLLLFIPKDKVKISKLNLAKSKSSVRFRETLFDFHPITLLSYLLTAEQSTIYFA